MNSTRSTYKNTNIDNTWKLV